MFLTFYDSIFVFKNYNILILYDYRYYCDFNILFNTILIRYRHITDYKLYDCKLYTKGDEITMNTIKDGG